MNRSLLAGCAGLLLTLSATATAVADTVTVRVEGTTSTLVRSVDVDPSTVGNLVRGGGNCNGTRTAAGALELATGGNWDGTNDPNFGVFVDRITSESFRGNFDRYWLLLINDEEAGEGACTQAVQDGDEVTFAAACGNVTTNCATGGVLAASAGAVAKLGQPLAVTVTQTTSGFGSPTSTAPADGATITGGGTTATTGADGIGRVTLTQRGPVELVVTRNQQVRDEVSTCVTDGADGFCGTVAPDGTTLPAGVGGTGAVPGDKAAPRAAITNIGEGQRFSRRKAPRKLEASVSDSSGLLQVKLSLTRQVGKRCSYFSRTAEKFRKIACGKHPVFKVGDRGDVSYLLPSRLGEGRYVFDVLATDKAFNRDTLARGRNRIVFTVG